MTPASSDAKGSRRQAIFFRRKTDDVDEAVETDWTGKLHHGDVEVERLRSCDRVQRVRTSHGSSEHISDVTIPCRVSVIDRFPCVMPRFSASLISDYVYASGVTKVTSQNNTRR